MLPKQGTRAFSPPSPGSGSVTMHKVFLTASQKTEQAIQQFHIRGFQKKNMFHRVGESLLQYTITSSI